MAALPYATFGSEQTGPQAAHSYSMLLCQPAEAQWAVVLAVNSSCQENTPVLESRSCSLCHWSGLSAG